MKSITFLPCLEFTDDIAKSKFTTLNLALAAWKNILSTRPDDAEPENNRPNWTENRGTGNWRTE